MLYIPAHHHFVVATVLAYCQNELSDAAYENEHSAVDEGVFVKVLLDNTKINFEGRKSAPVIISTLL